jgi:hypothetical protein
MGITALKPAAGDGPGIALGVFLSLVLHFVAFIAVAMIGDAMDPRQGAYFVLPFLVFIGIAQWPYLAPFAWLLWRRGWTGTAKGVIIAGVLLLIFNGLFYVGLQLRSVQSDAEAQRIQRYERAHPTDLISANGIVLVVDANHFEFKRDDDGSVVSLQTWNGLDYVLLKKNGGYEKKTAEILKPGVRVSVDYSQEREKPPVSANIVRVYEDGAIK